MTWIKRHCPPFTDPTGAAPMPDASPGDIVVGIALRSRDTSMEARWLGFLAYAAGRGCASADGADEVVKAATQQATDAWNAVHVGASDHGRCPMIEVLRRIDELLTGIDAQRPSARRADRFRDSGIGSPPSPRSSTRCAPAAPSHRGRRLGADRPRPRRPVSRHAPRRHRARHDQHPGHVDGATERRSRAGSDPVTGPLAQEHS